MKKYLNKDYFLFFQAEGLNLLFADICDRYYGPFDCIVTGSGSKYTYYVSRYHMEVLAKERYASLYKDMPTARSFKEQFLQDFNQLEELKKEITSGVPITVDLFDTTVRLLGSIIYFYSKYDPIYTDNLFKDDRKNISEFIDLVMDTKNYLREYLNKAIFNHDSQFVMLAKALSRDLRVPEEDVKFSTIQELRTAIETGVLDTSHMGSNRDFVMIADNQEFIHLRGDEATTFIKDFTADSNVLKDQTLAGTSVSTKGVFTGRVVKMKIDYTKLEESIREINDIPEGIVLVTETTVPEMVPAMKKSIAIVTDMGGMLSHAAITARELKKPCVIGTRFATKVLESGDTVEVDADNGTVRILS